jgi:endoglucanase
MKEIVVRLNAATAVWQMWRLICPIVIAVLLSVPCVGHAEKAAGGQLGEPRISVRGRHLVDAQGNIIQLRGANISGLEFVAVQGWSPKDPWGGQYDSKTLDVLLSWKANVVRLPLNEASWLGYPCLDGDGKVRDPDPGHNYQDVVKKVVAQAAAKGLYVILDLHMTAPDDSLLAVGNVKAICPVLQNPLTDADHTVDFWISIANTFKNSPNVLFELFNEPYFDWKYTAKDDWEVLRDGGVFRAYKTGTKFIDGHPWKTVGMQQLIDAIRKTGATNIVLVGGPNWTQRLDGWLKYKPTDPLKQLAAAWHAYPAFGKKWGTEEYNHPGLGDPAYKWAEEILAADIPLIITETGDRNAVGTKGAPFVSRVLPWADRNGISYLGWTFNVWPNKEEAVLLKSASGAPTDGYGEYFKSHLECVARNAGTCP